MTHFFETIKVSNMKTNRVSFENIFDDNKVALNYKESQMFCIIALIKNVRCQ